jgi:hypothetical protein
MSADSLPDSVAALWERMNERQRDDFMLFMLRLANQDARAYRYAQLHADGAISLSEMLAAMRPRPS